MKSKIDFVEGKTGKCLIQMVVPLLLAMVLTMAYNLVDSLWVGNLLGENGYAALTNATSVVLILSAIAMGSGNGISILIAQKIGEKKKERVDEAIATLTVMAIVFSVAVTLIMELCLTPVLTFFNTPEEIFGMAKTYLSVYLVGYPFIFIYMQLTSVFRSFGDSVFQFKGMLISTLLNAVIDPIFIHFMGLSGAAWATVLSEMVCVLFVILYHQKKKLFTFSFKNTRSEYVLPLLKDAIPSAFQNCMPAISSAVMVSIVSTFGITTIAAYGVTSKLEIILFYPAMAMNMALTAIVGQCIGSGRLDRAKDYLKCSLLLGGGFMAVLSLLVIPFSGRLSHLFVDSMAVEAIVVCFFSIISVGYVLYMLTSCFLGHLSGIGKPTVSMTLMFVYYIVIRVPLAFILVHTSLALNGIWFAILISHVGAALIAATVSTMQFKSNKNKQINKKFANI